VTQAKGIRAAAAAVAAVAAMKAAMTDKGDDSSLKVDVTN
jgi:hypothetical protein